MALVISQSEIQEAMEIILDACDNCDVNLDWLTDNDWVLDELRYSLPDDWDIECGASKMVFVPANKPYVIKLPLRSNEDLYHGSSYYSSWENEDTGSYHSHEYYAGENEEFSHAVYPLSGTYGADYCRSEVEFYEVAKAYHIDEMFAETREIGERRGITFYAQEKCLPLSQTDDPSKTAISEEIKQEYEATFSKSLNPHFSRSGVVFVRDFELRIADVYGITMLSNFVKFKAKERTGDYHSSNIGFFAATGKPCVFDYSGYWD